MSSRYVTIIIAMCGGIFFSSLLLAQNSNIYGEEPSTKKSMLDVHAGYLDPNDVQPGMIFGAAFISTFDDAVDIGFGLDIFQKSYSEEVEVSTQQVGETQSTTIATRLDYKRFAEPGPACSSLCSQNHREKGEHV